MALTCRQCGVVGSVIDTICRGCGTVLTNGSMPVINNPGSIASYNNNPQNQPPQWNQPNNNQYNSPHNNNQNWQNQYQNNNYQNNNVAPWQGYQNQPPANLNNPYPYQQNPYSQGQNLQNPYQVLPQTQQPPQMQMQRWSSPQANWGQPQGQQVFIVNNVHPMGLYQERKSPALSVVLSFLLTGAGQLYNGQVGKGLLMLGACVVMWGFFLGWVVTLWSIYDAYSTAKKINSGQRV